MPFPSLKKYLKLIDPKTFIDARVYEERDESKSNIIWVGMDGSVPRSDDDTVKIDIATGEQNVQNR